jgi:pimeloyl-ACP methyl ester carboxylesterase
MTLNTTTGVETTFQVGEVALHLLRGGSGRPALVLHGIEGPEGWLAFHDRLARSADVYAPSHPGFGDSKRPEWMESIHHQAAFYEWFLRDAGLEQVDLVGFGIGGWIAAEMATMNSQNLAHLVLVGAAGVKPVEGEMLDIFVRRWRDVVEACVDNPDAEEFQRIYTESPIVDFGGHREAGRTMTTRMCYRPYMYSPALPALLGGVRTPTLIVWGTEDRIIPVECADLYRQAVRGARVEVMEDCGHWPHFEKPAELAEIVSRFIGG